MTKISAVQALVMCDPLNLEYDFKTRVGILWLPKGHCTDQNGCIKLFQAIDPEVIEILTFSGRNRDAVYKLERDGWAGYL